MRSIAGTVLVTMGLAAGTVFAGTVNLAGDPSFDAFPQACDIPGAVGCWDGDSNAGVWVDTVGDGNDQAGGSGPPSAQCNITGGQGIEGNPFCLMQQCIDISAVPSGSFFEYGIAHRFIDLGSYEIFAAAFDNGDCLGLGDLRDQFTEPSPENAWSTLASSFVSQPGDVAVVIGYRIELSELAGVSGRGAGEGSVRVDDGFLLVDVDDTSPLEIPTLSTVGIGILTVTILIMTVVVLRRRRPHA